MKKKTGLIAGLVGAAMAGAVGVYFATNKQARNKVSNAVTKMMRQKADSMNDMADMM